MKRPMTEERGRKGGGGGKREIFREKKLGNQLKTRKSLVGGIKRGRRLLIIGHVNDERAEGRRNRKQIQMEGTIFTTRRS